MALRRIVHGDQRFIYERPLRAGDRVQAILTIDKVRTRGAADIISSSVHIESVRANWSVRPRPPSSTAARRPVSRPGLRRAARRSRSVPSPAAADGPFTRADLVRYAGAWTDFNPIHYSERFAAQVDCRGWSRTAC